MAKNKFVNANVEISTDTFAGLIDKTNQVLTEMGVSVVTTGLTSDGDTTIGNTHISGTASATTIVAGTDLRGGTVSTPGVLTISSNSHFNSDTYITVDATSTFANNVTVTDTFTASGGLFDISSANTAFSGVETSFNVTDFIVNTSGSSTFTGTVNLPAITDINLSDEAANKSRFFKTNATTGNLEYSQISPTDVIDDGNNLLFSILPTGTTSSTVAVGDHTHDAADVTTGTFAIGRIPTGTTSSTVAVGNHTHDAADTTSGTFAIARIPTGTTSSTVAVGNHTHAAADISGGSFDISVLPVLPPGGDNGVATTVARSDHVHGAFTGDSGNITGYLTVGGEVNFNGSNTHINSTNVTITDEIPTIGTNASDDNKDRGIEFKYNDGTAKTGFFGFDDSASDFTFLVDTTNTNGVISGTLGTITANFNGSFTGNADTATQLQTARNISLGGDVTGSASFDGTSNITITSIVSDDSHYHGDSSITDVAVGKITGGNTAFNKNFGGSGVATTVSRSDHNHSGTYDNYSSWSIAASGTVGTETIVSGETVTFTGTGGATVTRSGNDITIDTTAGGVYTHPTHPGDDINLDTGPLTGASVISDLDFNVTTDTEGHVTSAAAAYSTRNLTAANVGAAATSHTHSAADVTTGSFDISVLPVGTTATDVAVGNHTHDAADVTTGTFSILRIPTGTTSSTVAVGNHTHSAADVTTGTFSTARIPNLSASKITSGTFSINRIPTGTSGTTVALGNHGHDAADVTSGTFSTARIPDLNASKIDAGTFGTGNYTFNGAVTGTNFTATSDINVKTHITPLENASNKVNALNGVTFNWIEDFSPDTDRQAGLIAQDVQSVLPEAVKENEDGVLSVNYSGVIALLVEVVKEQNVKIDRLTRIVDGITK